MTGVGIEHSPRTGVIALVPDFWNVPWQSRHHLMNRLARYFPVVWMDPPHSWRQSFNLRSGAVMEHVDANLWVYHPESWLPQVGRPAWLATLTEAARLRRARSWLMSRGCRHLVLYVWRPDFRRALDLVDHDASVYHIDDEYSFSTVETPIDTDEAALIAQADLVIVHSAALLEKKGVLNPRTLLVPNGVDFAAYSSTRPEPSDLASIPHPRIGYTGYVKPQLDWPLIRALATRHADWSFVFVGATRQNVNLNNLVGDLLERPNVFFLGSKTTDELASYPQYFDCCVMPYRDDAYTKYIYPMKLHEYLASGRPIVGRRIRSLLDYASLIELADDLPAWSAAIERCLSPAANTLERQRNRQSLAREHDWNILAHQVASAIAERLGKPEIGDAIRTLNPPAMRTRSPS